MDESYTVWSRRNGSHRNIRLYWCTWTKWSDRTIGNDRTYRKYWTYWITRNTWRCNKHRCNRIHRNYRSYRIYWTDWLYRFYGPNR